jgi:hypothetical protein
VRRALAALALVACGGGGEPSLSVVIDVPAAGTPANPYADIDSLELSIAHAGQSAALALQRVERGDTPILPSVPFADDLVVHLSGARAGVELAYGRTCVLSVAAGALPAPPHLYFSRVVKWAAGPAPAAAARAGAGAYTAPDGSAVFVGGDGEAAVERFDPRLAAFAAAGTSAARTGDALAPLPDGTALRIGGATANGPVGFFELLSPLLGRVDTVNDDRLRVVAAAAATLVDGSVLVNGGFAGSPAQPTGATWTLRLGAAGTPDPPQLMTATLAAPRARHTLTRLGDDVGAVVLAIGGEDAAGEAVGAAEIYEPLREGYAASHPAMVRPRWDHRAVRLPDGSVLVVGGRDGAGPVDVIELYLPHLAQFAAAGKMPARAGLTELTATPLPDGRVLLAGGRDAGGAPTAVTFIARLDPIDGTVDLSQTDSLSTPRTGHAAAALCDGTVLVVGGAPGSERYNPPSAGRR